MAIACKSRGGEYYKVNLELRAYWKAKESFSVGEGLLFNSRIVVASAMHREVLSKIHEGHQGMRGVYFVLGVQCGGQESHISLNS